MGDDPRELWTIPHVPGIPERKPMDDATPRRPDGDTDAGEGPDLRPLLMRRRMTAATFAEAGGCCKQMHDEDSCSGLWVQNGRGNVWLAYGDGRLRDIENYANAWLVQQAVAASIDGVIGFSRPLRAAQPHGQRAERIPAARHCSLGVPTHPGPMNTRTRSSHAIPLLLLGRCRPPASPGPAPSEPQAAYLFIGPCTEAAAGEHPVVLQKEPAEPEELRAKELKQLRHDASRSYLPRVVPGVGRPRREETDATIRAFHPRMSHLPRGMAHFPFLAVLLAGCANDVSPSQPGEASTGGSSGPANDLTSDDGADGESGIDLCGNGIIDEGEECELGNVPGTCADLGLEGDFACTTSCQLIDDYCYASGMQKIDNPTRTWFAMGDEGDPDWVPVHMVLVDTFFLDTSEVTVIEYEECIEAGDCAVPQAGWGGCNVGIEGRGDHPVNCVTWHMADDYCRSVGKRLPTEAEWEWAARWRLEWTYPWGDGTPSCDRAVMHDITGAGCGQDSTWPVGSKPQGDTNVPFGYSVEDMAGNVSEWVADWHGSYRLTPVENPTGPESGTEKVYRGGSWEDGSGELEAYRRWSAAPDSNSSRIGFRCALDVP